MALEAASRRYERAVAAVGGVIGKPAPCPLGLELARARLALIDELRSTGWRADPAVMRQLQSDRVRVRQAEASASRLGALDGATPEKVLDLDAAEQPPAVDPLDLK